MQAHPHFGEVDHAPAAGRLEEDGIAPPGSSVEVQARSLRRHLNMSDIHNGWDVDGGWDQCREMRGT